MRREFLNTLHQLCSSVGKPKRLALTAVHSCFNVYPKDCGQMCLHTIVVLLIDIRPSVGSNPLESVNLWELDLRLGNGVGFGLRRFRSQRR